MTKAELVAAVSQKADTPPAVTEKVLVAFFDTVATATLERVTR